MWTKEVGCVRKPDKMRTFCTSKNMNTFSMRWMSTAKPIFHKQNVSVFAVKEKLIFVYCWQCLSQNLASLFPSVFPALYGRFALLLVLVPMLPCYHFRENLWLFLSSKRPNISTINHYVVEISPTLLCEYFRLTVKSKSSENCSCYTLHFLRTSLGGNFNS